MRIQILEAPRGTSATHREIQGKWNPNVLGPEDRDSDRAKALYKALGATRNDRDYALCKSHTGDRWALIGLLNVHTHYAIETDEPPTHCDICGQSFRGHEPLTDDEGRHFHKKCAGALDVEELARMVDRMLIVESSKVAYNKIERVDDERKSPAVYVHKADCPGDGSISAGPRFCDHVCNGERGYELAQRVNKMEGWSWSERITVDRVAATNTQPFPSQKKASGTCDGRDWTAIEMPDCEPMRPLCRWSFKVKEEGFSKIQRRMIGREIHRKIREQEAKK